MTKQLLQSGWRWWLVFIGLCLVSFAAYGYALSMPMFWDDVMNFNWLSTHTLTDTLMQRGSNVASFRPVQFAIWKLLYLLLGRYDAFVLHGLSFGLHLANGLLLLCLARRLHSSWLFAWTAAVSFILFPFGFQVVVPINALSYLLVTSCLLVGMWACVAGRIGLLTMACLLAPLCHETGLLAFAMMGALLLCGFGAIRQWWVFFVALLATLLGDFLWSRVSEGGGHIVQMLSSLFTRSTWNTAYFLQALAFPISHVGGTVEDVLIVSVVGLVIWMLFLTVCQLRHKRLPILRIAGFGILLFALAAGPAWFVLDASYLAESPRVLYPGAIGIALVWTVPLSAIRWRELRNRNTLTWLNIGLSCGAVLVALGSIGWSWRYLGRRAELFARMRQVIGTLVTHGHVQDIRQDRELPTVVINFPEWFHVIQPEYALGHDGLTLISADRQLDDLYALNENKTISRQRFIAVALPDVQDPAGQYHAFGPVHTVDSLQEILRSSGPVAVTQFIHNKWGNFVWLTPSGQFMPQPSQETIAQFDDQIKLITVTTSLIYDRVEVAFDLQASVTLTRDMTIFVHVLDSSGQLVGQMDGYPLAGTSPLRLWRVGDRWHDRRLISLKLSSDGYPTVVQVQIGLYNTIDGQRIRAFSATGQRLVDDAVVVDASK